MSMVRSRRIGGMPALAVTVATFAALPVPGGAQARTAGQIVIEHPAEWAPGTRGLLVQRSRSLRISGTASYPGGVAQVAANGTPLFLTELADGSWRFDGYVEIKVGADSVAVRGLSRAGDLFGQAFPLRAELPGGGASDADRWNSALSGFRGERWAVVVGISDYVHPGIPDLQFAHRDAQEFAGFLRSPMAGLGGFDAEKVLLLTNEEANYRNLRSALFTFLKNPTEDDVVYIFWAGHGSPDPDRLSDLYLLPHDADPNDIAATGIRMEDLQDAIRRSRARDKVIITDACHSAGVGFGGTRALGGMNQINAAFIERLAGSSGFSVAITSSEATQLSNEGIEWGGGHGVFTFHLLEGLRGAADENGDQIIDVREMFEYVREQVKRDTQSGQIPTISQTAYNPAWPMSAIFDDATAAAGAGRERRPVRTAAVAGSTIVNLMEGTWSVPDSINAFVGVIDTIAIRLNGRAGPKVDGTLLTWNSSNLDVARVTREGALLPEAPGMTTVSASFFNEKRVEMVVRVYDRPIQVEFTPRTDTIEVVRGETVRLAAAMELPTGEILRGVLPAFQFSDSLIVSLSRDAQERIVEGEFKALREGTATITGALGGTAHTWTFKVGSPGLAIVGLPPLILAGDEIDVRANYTRRDGSALAEALGVSWESADTTVLKVRLGGVSAGTPGRTRLIASAGSARDTVDIAVFGDLLVTTERDGRGRIYTVATLSGTVTPIGEGLGAVSDAVLAPDGSSIAFVSKGEGDRAPRIYVMGSDGTNARRLVAEKRGRFVSLGLYHEGDPAWSHDGRWLYFTSNRDGNYDVYRVATAQEGAEPERIVSHRSVERGLATSPDRPRIAFERVVSQTASDIVLALADGSEEVNFTSSRVAPGPSLRRPRETQPAWLPGNEGVLLVEEVPGSNVGESLSRFDVATAQRITLLVRPQPGQEIIYAVSPRGDRVAYNQRPRRGSGDARIVLVDISGTALQTVALPAGERILAVRWGAVHAVNSQRR